jgi:phospholipase/lecithinase/hemolysin
MKASPPRARLSHSLLRGAAIAASLIVVAASASSASAKEKPKPKPEFSAIYVVGDSLSDTGRLHARTLELTGGALGIPPAPYYWNGRSSNGPLWPEYLAPVLDMTYDPLDNFAWAGANTGRINAWEPDFGVDLPGMLDELDEYVAGLGRHRKADKKALYVVFGGSNDFFRLFKTPPDDPAVVIPEGVVNVVTIVGALQRLGAEHIVVIDLPNIGLTPRAQALGPEGAAGATYLSVLFNTLLDNALDGLRCDVMRVSSFDLLNAIAADPAAYGFTNVTVPGLVALQANPAADTSGFLFWDDIHPTTRTHALIAELIAQAIDDAARRKCKLHGFDPRPHYAGLCGGR